MTLSKVTENTCAINDNAAEKFASLPLERNNAKINQSIAYSNSNIILPALVGMVLLRAKISNLLANANTLLNYGSNFNLRNFISRIFVEHDSTLSVLAF